MGAFTLAEIDATLARLKAEYEKLNHMEEYGLGGRQSRHREMEKIRREMEHWERRRDRHVRGGFVPGNSSYTTHLNVLVRSRPIRVF
jgi:hypothetical protein